jgi:hypothetical protein
MIKAAEISHQKISLLCKLGIHREKFITTDVAGGSKCSCGKKSTTPVVWPITNQQEKALDFVKRFYALSKCRCALTSVRDCWHCQAEDILTKG